jgi:hypothetical protein
MNYVRNGTVVINGENYARIDNFDSGNTGVLKKPAALIRVTDPQQSVDHIVAAMNGLESEKKSVLQDWVMELPLRMQGTLLTAVRGCDLTPKYALGSLARRLTAAIRWSFMNPADPREVDILGAFFSSQVPVDLIPSELGHLPWHWLSHATHAIEVLAYKHPDSRIMESWQIVYAKIVKSFHLNVETPEQFEIRMTEDRIANGTVVS